MRNTGLLLLFVASLLAGAGAMSEDVSCFGFCGNTCVILKTQCNSTAVKDIIKNNATNSILYRDECHHVAENCTSYCKDQCTNHIDAEKECENRYKNRRESCYDVTFLTEDCELAHKKCIQSIDDKVRNVLFKEALRLPLLNFVLSKDGHPAHEETKSDRLH